MCASNSSEWQCVAVRGWHLPSPGAAQAVQQPAGRPEGPLAGAVQQAVPTFCTAGCICQFQMGRGVSGCCPTPYSSSSRAAQDEQDFPRPFWRTGTDWSTIFQDVFFSRFRAGAMHRARVSRCEVYSHMPVSERLWWLLLDARRSGSGLLFVHENLRRITGRLMF